MGKSIMEKVFGYGQSPHDSEQAHAEKQRREAEAAAKAAEEEMRRKAQEVDAAEAKRREDAARAEKAGKARQVSKKSDTKTSGFESLLLDDGMLPNVTRADRQKVYDYLHPEIGKCPFEGTDDEL